MTELLRTKLYAPAPRADAVGRARLIERLEKGATSRLTLVSAPPGFGKTTVVTQWLAATGREDATAWVSLDAADDEPATFWAYVVAAIARVAPDAARGARELLDAGPAPVDAAIASLVNGLTDAAVDLVLVLDDLHVVEDPAILERLGYLLDHLPPRLHLVVLTRSDPGLPLARMRARGELTEIRASDLRFTPEEAAAYLNERMDLGLGATDVAALEARTEGWIAALQLAALSMQGREDQAAFVASFAGDDRFVVDYLADEVLENQADDVRDFLLRTAILDRLTGPLCDAVTGGTDGAAMLERLDRRNLFLVRLDDRRRWYRYHHLFADLLRARLLDQRPAEVADLHRRASAWWEASGEPAEAIAHSLAGGDVEHAAELIEGVALALLRHRQEATVRRWLTELPDRAFDGRPVLADAHAGCLLVTGQTQAVDHRLAQAERWVAFLEDGGSIETALDAGMQVTDLDGLRRLPGGVALHRAGLAWMQGDMAGAISHARRALDIARDEPMEAGGAAAILGLAAWTSGDLVAAHGAWSEAITALGTAGHHADVLGCSISLGDIEIAQGRLHDARLTYERGLKRSAEHGEPVLRGAADMHVGLAELFLEWNDLAAVRHHLDTVAELGEAMGLPQHPYRRRVARAGLLRVLGDTDGALTLLDEAERVYDGDLAPDVRPVASTRARLWVATGRHADAVAWARARGLSPDDEPVYLHEHEHITLARALLAQAIDGGSRAGAAAVSAFLDRLLAAAEAGGRGRSIVELQALRALACRAAGDRDAATASLDLALALAEPEGYVRLFLDEGPAMAELLTAAARRMPSSYASRLLAADDRPAQPAGRQPLVEPLSERELEVLRLLATDLDGPEIAAELVVSLNTMRTHTKNIYAKLGVTSRRAAVTRATELRLLSRDR